MSKGNILAVAGLVFVALVFIGLFISSMGDHPEPPPIIVRPTPTPGVWIKEYDLGGITCVAMLEDDKVVYRQCFQGEVQ